MKNGTVFSLGIALLELSHQNPLAAFQQPEDLNEEGQVDAMTEVSVATRLATRLSDMESKNYAKAALRFVTCDFNVFSHELEDDAFKRAFFEGVVLPLQVDLEFLTGVH